MKVTSSLLIWQAKKAIGDNDIGGLEALLHAPEWSCSPDEEGELLVCQLLPPGVSMRQCTQPTRASVCITTPLCLTRAHPVYRIVRPLMHNSTTGAQPGQHAQVLVGNTCNFS